MPPECTGYLTDTVVLRCVLNSCSSAFIFILAVIINIIIHAGGESSHLLERPTREMERPDLHTERKFRTRDLCHGF